MELAKDIRAVFNDTSDPSYKFENQCVCYKRVCTCGTRFPVGSTVCPSCGAVRPRCGNRAMEGEEVCRAHATGRPFSLYSKLAATLSDGALEELVEQDDRDLSQEYALAKVALSCVLDGEVNPDSKTLLAMVKDFFTIAEKKKTIEKGQVLNIAWNDDLVNALRKRVRLLVRTMNEVLSEYIDDEELRTKILKEVQSRTKMPGNAVTVPLNPNDYVQESEEDTQ